MKRETGWHLPDHYFMGFTEATRVTSVTQQNQDDWFGCGCSTVRPRRDGLGNKEEDADNCDSIRSLHRSDSSLSGMWKRGVKNPAGLELAELFVINVDCQLNYLDL